MNLDPQEPDSYSPIPEEEKKQQLVSGTEVVFDASDDFKRDLSAQVEELGNSNRQNNVLQSSNVSSGLLRGRFQTSLNSSSNINTAKKKIEERELLFDFTVWMRCQIIAYHLVEPVLVACLVGTCLNMPQFETLCVIVVSMALYFPLLLSGVPARIKTKMIASVISLVFVFLFLIFKLTMYFLELPSFVSNTYRTNFLGIFFGQWAKTFVIDLVLLALIGLLLWNQTSQLDQCRKGILLGEKKISKQIDVKFLHPVFGESLSVFYTISYLVFLIDTFFYQSFVQLAILIVQLLQCYLWSLKIEFSIKVRKLTLRAMQVVTFLTLSVAFMFSMPYILNGFLTNQDNARLIELMGYIQLTSTNQWVWRVHIILLASAIVLSEVFFVAENIHKKSPKRGFIGKVEDALLKRAPVKTSAEEEKKSTFLLSLDKLWGILSSPLTLWIARTCCFVWVYMYHDYQSLLALIWLIHSTVYVRSTLFVKFTAYFYLPAFNLLVLWYFTTNVFGLILWQNMSQEQTIEWYRYGFYKMKIPALEFGFMFFTLFMVSFYCRQNFEKVDTGIKTNLVIEDLMSKSTMWQIIYLIVLYLEYPLYLAMVMSGLAKMDFYHVFLLFIFVAYTLFPKFFVKNSIFLLLYADFFVLTKYVWTLVTNNSQQPNWLQIIGISSDYDPYSTREYFRYPPTFDQWLLVFLTFCLYRRQQLVGTDYNKIKQQELDCIKDLYYKSPTTKKVFTTIDILINHCIIIFTFLLFIIILVFMRRSFLNLVSLMLVLLVICTYMSRGIKRLNYFWNILTFYQAFVLLSILAYQFVYQSGISQQQWFINRTSDYSYRLEAFVYWAGYYQFQSPIWYHFFPYVILFSFAVSIRHRFRVKQEMENLEIVLPEQIVVDNLLYSQDDVPRQSVIREASLANSFVSGVSRINQTRQEAEAELSDYEIQLQENYFNMLYQIQYPIWKSKAVWPAFTSISRYFNFLLSVVIFCFSLYYQIALIWLIFLIIYLMQAWSVSNLHNKYMVEQFDQFKPTHSIRNAAMSKSSPIEQINELLKQAPEVPKTARAEEIYDRIHTIKLGKNFTELEFEPLQKRFFSLADASLVQFRNEMKRRRTIQLTEQEVLIEYEKFNINVHKTSLESRHGFWLSQFVLVIVSIFFVYLSDFVTTTYIDPVSGTSISLIQNLNIQNKTLFLYFWSGFLRQVPNDETSLTNQYGLIKVYYPFFVLIFLLIIEKLSQLWLIDKFGTTEAIIKKWEKIEQSYNEIFNKEDAKSQVAIKDKARTSKFSRVKVVSINGSNNNFSRSLLQQQTDLDGEPRLTGRFTARPQLLLDMEAMEDEAPVSIQETTDFELINDSDINKDSVFDAFDPRDKAATEEIVKTLQSMLKVKSKMTLHKSLKICFEEFIILLLWFSCIYKQSIFSFAIFFVLAYHTFRKSQRNSDKPMLLVRYTVVFILVCEYTLFLTNLTSYNSPAPFPVSLTPPVTIDGVVYTSPYPSWNSTTNQDEFYYFYIPLYFAMPYANRSTPPSVNVNLVSYFSVFVSADQQNGMWFDFIITLLVVFYLDSCNFFILTKRIDVVSSEECNKQIQRYQEIMKHSEKTTEEVKEELSVMISQNRLVEYWSKWLYQDFILVMIAFVLIISIYSRTLLSFGYFLFCMILIFQSRKFFITEDSHKTQKKLLRNGLLPYLLADIFVSLIYQLPVKVFDDYSHIWPSIVGFETYWNSTPQRLPLGYVGSVTTTLQNPLTALYLKGVAYLCVMIQLAIIESRGFKKFKKKFTNENEKNRDLIGKGIAYRFNNFKSKKILQAAKDFSELQKMLFDVKELIMRRDNMFKRQQTIESKLTKKKADDMLSSIQEIPQAIEPPKKDFKANFNREVKQEIEKRMKKLNVLEKMYLWLRRHLVNDILFKHSLDHLTEIVEDFKNGRTCEKSNLERGIIICVKRDLLKKIEDDFNEQKKARAVRLRDLKDEIDSDKYEKALEEEKAQIKGLMQDYIEFKEKQIGQMQLRPWQQINIETFQSWKTLGFSYLVLMYKIVASYTEWICYIFMLSATYCNGGLLYMVYPAMIFGYALLEESKPGSTFWFFTIIFTQVIILVQFTVQLTVWDYFLHDQTTAFYEWTRTWNLGLVYLSDFTFQTCLSQFVPEILIIISVLVHITRETLEGVFDKPPYIFESFEDGLRRYRLNINADDTVTMEELKKKFQVESVIKNDLEFSGNLTRMLRQRSRSFDSMGFSDEVNCPILRSKENIFEGVQVPMRTASMDCLFFEHREKQTTIEQLKETMTVLWDNGFFQRLFPKIKQQKPGKDYYVWTTLISFILCIYIVLFFTQMSGQKTTLADQYSANIFQGYMVITLFVMIAIMVIDRIFYGSHAQLTKHDKPAQMVQNQPWTQSPPELLMQRRATAANIPIRTQPDFVIPKAREASPSLPFKRNNSLSSQKRPASGTTAANESISESQIVEDRSQTSHESEAIDEDEEVLKMKAYEKALTPVIRQSSWKRIVKVYYFWSVLLLVHWFVFFSMPNQQKYCTEVVNRAFCNKFTDNPSLICFYTLFVLYFILQAFQLKKGMPEIRKGGFMVGKYDTVSKTIFNVWYYIPFLFELRSIIDWTFSETALDIFQWLKLAEVQANMYQAKCYNKSYRQKELGKKIAVTEKTALGCGLMLLILTLIAGPMLLFSSINPVSSSNLVSDGQLVFSLQIKNTAQQITYNAVLFQTDQIVDKQTLTQQEFNNLEFDTYPTTTAVFYPDQVQALEFAQSSDTVWIVSQPTRTAILDSLIDVQNGVAGVSITAQLTSTFNRPSGSVKYSQNLALTNQTQPQIIATLIDQIQCNGATSPIVNPFPVDMVDITVNCGSNFASTLQSPTYTSGFNLNYYCNNTNPSTNYWALDQVFPSNINATISEEYTELFPEAGFGFFTFSQNSLPVFLSAYSSSILIFYATIVYVIASTLRSGLVPLSAQIFITDAPLTEDILMICTSIHIYRMQRDLEQEEELYFILIDIMRSPEMIKELSKSSLKGPKSIESTSQQ